MTEPFDTEELSEIYDGFAPAYDAGRCLFDNVAQLRMLDQQIGERADVLDAGCGSGTPVLRFFSQRGCRVTGTDISHEMLHLAAINVPEARLQIVDSAELDFASNSFDLITSFYSLFHLPLEKQKATFAHFFRLLRAGGVAYFTLASEQYTGEPIFDGTKAFAGVELPYHHVTPSIYRSLLKTVGFSVESTEHRLIGGETMLWVYVRKESQ